VISDDRAKYKKNNWSDKPNNISRDMTAT